MAAVYYAEEPKFCLRCFRSGSKSRDMSFELVASIVALSTMFILVRSVIGDPLPAPDLQNCHSSEKCCLPAYTGKPAIKFQPNTSLPMRTRRPAQLVDEAYIAKYEKAYELLRRLPDSDPRSLINQANLHCLYCDDGIYYPNVSFPLEIHNGWFFMPWHRMFIYFHERILAKVLGDDAFALPYWNWDYQTTTAPYANILPYMYAKNSSSLWDVNRNKCAEPPYIVDLNTIGGCTDKEASVLLTENNRIMYTQLVTGAPTPSLFFGMPYRLGDVGGRGPGVLEDNPHGTVHAWVGNPNASTPLNDMGNFETSARDPVFYAHHSNIDRIWTLWKNFSGGIHKEPTDPDFLNSEFTFYDEEAKLITVKVSQILDIDSLRYKYESSPTPWVTNGVKAGEENTIPYCSPTNPSQVYAMITSTKPLIDGLVLFDKPLTFRVHRPDYTANGTNPGIEVLELEGIEMDITGQAHWHAFLFYPSADESTSTGCPEFFGTFNFLPHVGQQIYNPARIWRAALGSRLQILDKDYVSHVVVTLVQTTYAPIRQHIRFKTARIVYDTGVE